MSFGERLRGSTLVRLMAVTPEWREEAWDMFKRYRDKDLSFTDCTSFVVMRALGITHALSLDHHPRSSSPSHR